MLKEWARKLMLAYAWVSIVVGAISMEMVEAQLHDDDCDDGKKDNNGYWIEAAGHAIQEIIAPRRSSSDTTLKKGQQPR